MEMRSFVSILHKKYAHYYINLYFLLLWWDHTSKKVIISPITMIFSFFTIQI